MVRRSKEFFIWIPRDENSDYKIEIDGTDETAHVMGGEFIGAIIGEESGFQVRLDNNNERFTDLYEGNETVDFFLGFGTATKRLTFKIERLERQRQNKGNVIVLSGPNRFHSDLLDITVTESYSGATGDAILKDLISKYLSSSYTSTNVNAVTETPSLIWEDISLYDAIVDICNACGCDAYVDINQDFHFFKRGTVNNDDEAVVWSDNLIALEGLRTDIIDVKNQVRVASEDTDGLPILYTKNDGSSQTKHGTKKEVFKDTNISDTDEAEELATAKLKSEPEERGSSKSFFLPSIQPGQSMWITDPFSGIHNRFRIVQFTHKIHDQETQCVVSQSRNLATYIKERKQKENKIAKTKNPYNMDYTFNIRFSNEDKIAAKDSNVTVSDGNIHLSSGSEGSFTTITHTAPVTATSVQLQVAGESLSGTIYKINVGGGQSFQDLTRDALVTLSEAGKKIKLKVELKSSSTLIKSIALLYK